MPMKTRVRKWGNSLAVRIPKSFAAEVGLANESPVDVSLSKGRLVVAPVAERPKHTLAQLLAQVTDDNLHGEITTSAPVGGEAW
jgi:antitoxin MazE